MTAQELKKHIKQIQHEIDGLNLVIEADQRYIDRLQSDLFKIDVRPYVRQVQNFIEKNRQEIARHLATIEAWAQLITKESDRQIFVDHYLNGLSWGEIEKKYHYSHSTIFRSKETCFEQIAQNLVCQIVPDCNIKTDTAVSL